MKILLYKTFFEAGTFGFNPVTFYVRKFTSMQACLRLRAESSFIKVLPDIFVQPPVPARGVRRTIFDDDIYLWTSARFSKALEVRTN